MNYYDVRIWAYSLVIPSDPGSPVQGLRAAGLGAPRGASAQAQRSRDALGPAPQGKPWEKPWVKPMGFSHLGISIDFPIKPIVIGIFPYCKNHGTSMEYIGKR